MGWFAINILNIVPATRKGESKFAGAVCEQGCGDNKNP